MCGFAGVLGGQYSGAESEALRLLSAMTAQIVHRGPDDAGRWYDNQGRIGLGHRRLSILDLSPAGHQPMHSPSGHYVIAFNGEIYNHLELRNELEAKGEVAWRGHSDTETMLAGFDAWGIRQTVERCIGMFAFAVWHKASRVLTLARDRLGEKPLYYGWQGSGTNRVFLFGSELKALKVHPAFSAGIDRGALCLLLRHNAIPSPYSIYEGIAKLNPGCMLSLSLDRPEPQISQYWSLPEVARAGVAKRYSGSPEASVDHLDDLLKDAIRQQMVADVPLGAFLSGGDRFFCCGCADASAVEPAGQDIYDRL